MGKVVYQKLVEEMEVTDSHKFIENTVLGYVKFGGSLVEEDHYQARLKVCKGCEHFGTVRPIKGLDIEMDGCKICNCPSTTKPRAFKYFSFKKLRIVKAICPDETGNKWRLIDADF